MSAKSKLDSFLLSFGFVLGAARVNEYVSANRRLEPLGVAEEFAGRRPGIFV
jgi:hypothetical protein